MNIVCLCWVVIDLLVIVSPLDCQPCLLVAAVPVTVQWAHTTVLESAQQHFFLL